MPNFLITLKCPNTERSYIVENQPDAFAARRHLVRVIGYYRCSDHIEELPIVPNVKNEPCENRYGIDDEGENWDPNKRGAR